MPINLLFICSRNQWRSPTAEAIFRKIPGYCTRSRGTSKKAVRHVCAKDLQWADHIFVMERKHAQRLKAAHPEAFCYKKPIVLGIPDDYRYMDPALQKMLQAKVSPFLSEPEKSQYKTTGSFPVRRSLDKDGSPRPQYRIPPRL